MGFPIGMDPIPMIISKTEWENKQKYGYNKQTVWMGVDRVVFGKFQSNQIFLF